MDFDDADDVFGATPTDVNVPTLEGDDDGFSAFDDVDTGAAEDVFGISSTDAPSNEANDSKLRDWEEKREATLSERKEQAESDKAEVLVKGKEELEKFMSDRTERIAKKQVMNRSDEKQSMRDNEELMQNGSDWEKIAKLVDLRPSKGDEATSAKDRMRLLMLTLKQEKN